MLRHLHHRGRLSHDGRHGLFALLQLFQLLLEHGVLHSDLHQALLLGREPEPFLIADRVGERLGHAGRQRRLHTGVGAAIDTAVSIRVLPTLCL